MVTTRVASAKVIRVEVVHADGQWQLLRGGEPWEVKGAAGGGSLAELAAAGANTTRTWGADDIDGLLDEAHAHGLAVIVGIWLGHERHGFDYTDADQVAEQYERAHRTILRYRDHPAVLMWGIGNEMEGFEAGDNAAIWSAVNSIAELAHRLDPNHPTMTTTAEIGGERVKNVHRLCPAIDVHGINSYAGVASLPVRYREAGGTKPYLVTEFGPPGAWEAEHTEWNVPREPTSTKKADYYAKGYRALHADAELNLGSIAFIWSHKVEATPTWFGMALADGARLAARDTMRELWSGSSPPNRVPEIVGLTLEDRAQVKPGAEVSVRLDVRDPESDALRVEWVLREEAQRFNTGGDPSPLPPAVDGAIVKGERGHATVCLPETPGPYRLYATVRDDHGGAATANVPLNVLGDKPAFTLGGQRLPVVLYEDGEFTGPYAPSGYMGAYDAIEHDPTHDREPHRGEHSLAVRLTAEEGWGGVAWQDPPNDWGALPGGLDLRGASRVSFWARGARGGESVKFGLGLIGRDAKYPDTARVESGEVTLSRKWRHFVIDLDGANLERIKTGFYWVAPAPVEFYLDSVRIE